MKRTGAIQQGVDALRCRIYGRGQMTKNPLQRRWKALPTLPPVDPTSAPPCAEIQGR